MFGLFKKKIEPTFDFAALGADMHAHWLPGIDDGAKTLDDSIHYIKGLQEIGYTKLIASPHILWDLYRNTPEIIQRKLELVQKELKNQQIDIELHAAAEYFLDDYFADLIQKKEKLLTIKDNLLLVEFSTIHMSQNMKNSIFDAQMAGYQPILAHPERYAYLIKSKEVFHELKENGCLFQLNILSALGGYGKQVEELSAYLIKNNFYNYMGTDLHHQGHLARLKGMKATPLLLQLLDSGSLRNHLL